MAGEWIAYDISLPEKPEVQELIDTTGKPEEFVVFRLLRLWDWASMHCADGTARVTLARLSRLCGGDVAFWNAVVSVGWLHVNEDEGTVSLVRGRSPGHRRHRQRIMPAVRDARDAPAVCVPRRNEGVFCEPHSGR